LRRLASSETCRLSPELAVEALEFGKSVEQPAAFWRLQACCEGLSGTANEARFASRSQMFDCSSRKPGPGARHRAEQ
jgi:hypothetical protein